MGQNKMRKNPPPPPPLESFVLGAKLLGLEVLGDLLLAESLSQALGVLLPTESRTNLAR